MTNGRVSREARKLLNDTYGDAVHRICDTYNLHKLADPYGNIGRWFAAALADGTTDGQLYDSKRDCIRGQKHNEFYYMYLQVTPGDLEPRACAALLDVHRRMYAKGIRVPDPDHHGGGRDLIHRLTWEDMRNQIRSMFGKGHPSNILLPGRDF
jgi:hypothetical protein